jgi:charged multivesicular body protein 3
MHTQKSRNELKVLAKKGDVKSARILAKELVRANKQRDRLVSSKARVGSVQMQLQHQLCRSLMRERDRASAYARSDGEGDGCLSKIVRDHEDDEPAHQAATAKCDDARNEHGNDEGRLNLCLASHKSDTLTPQSGIMEEMMEETLDSVDDDELEDEADAEVDKVLFELTDGKLGQAGAVGAELPVSTLLGMTDARLQKKRKAKTRRRCRGCRGRCKIFSVDRSGLQFTMYDRLAVSRDVHLAQHSRRRASSSGYGYHRVDL